MTVATMSGGAIGTSQNDPRIVCRNLWKAFGSKPREFFATQRGPPTLEELEAGGYFVAIRNVNLDVMEGEIFVIMGLSGSGKSTLVRCLAGLLDATYGEVIFEGEDLQAMSEDALIEIRRHKMGMVFQHFALLPHLTVLGNVEFPLEIQRLEKTFIRRRALDMIELVGLKGRENYYPRELSGGQQQRVGIARSLAVEPDIWFLDEPFSALDPLIRSEMQNEFLRLQRLLHKTIVFITHDCNEAIRIADRIAIMQNGEIIQIGTPEQLVLQPTTDYVKAFTQSIPRAKVVTAGSIMVACNESQNTTIRIPANMTVDVLAPQLVDGEGDATVVDNANRPIGRITRQAVIEVLLGKGRGA